ncbi:hypothetical protein EBB07_16335 [Paenibacillaceae bacterium]|nr:hypothetical protein EBB07_16335 [Paenibacillaceae bacterium]
MVSQLTDQLNKVTMRMLKTYVQQEIDQHWQQVREDYLQELENIFAKGGDSAYGFYCRKLFDPITAELMNAGIIPRPIMPGLFIHSEEHWGSWEDRERRFWTVLQQGNGNTLGTLVSRIFHDHSRLRIPRSPQVYVIGETEPDKIAHMIVNMDPVSAENFYGGTNNE